MQYLGDVYYSVCNTQAEYFECMMFQKLIEGLSDKLDYPTVCLKNIDYNLLGFISTNNTNNFPVAEPMVIDTQFKPRASLAIKLYSFYDKIINRTYIFGVKKSN